MFAAPVFLYSFGIVEWRGDELRELDITTQEVVHLHRSLHPRSSLPRWYIPRDEVRRGLLGLECLRDRLVLDLASDVRNSVKPSLVFAHNHEFREIGAHLYRAANHAAESLGLVFHLQSGGIPVDSIARKSKSQREQIIRAAEQNILLQQHSDRPIHGVFFRYVLEQGLSVRLTFHFFKSAGLMSEAEGFICACQDDVINTLVYRSHVMGQVLQDTSCRAYKEAPETLMHVLSACPVRAVSGYIHRQNAALGVLYYFLRYSYAIDRTRVLPYVAGEIESVVVNERCKIYWNFSFATIRPIEATKPDAVLFDFDDKIIYVIEFSAPAKTNMSWKEEEKWLKYQDLLFQFH